ncbi:hypothetical protein Tsubulata_009611 [Turnera subulata]|uniref:CASP-like protein n=1 Tax=Turnera subulata TaxID=218843 RepID=A0A9Q0J036_9ROSI|nr:hypothetical protein Tsubulata_009611 [Turnera subulata]
MNNMEAQQKASAFDVMNGTESQGAINRSWRKGDLFLRGLALILTLSGAIVLGVNKQTKLVPVKILDSLPALNVPAEAKWHYLSAFVYFVVTNAIACSYAALSMLLSLSGKKGFVPIIMIIDLLMVALLFSSNGASTAIGVMGYEGNSHVRWNKVCDVFDKFCNQTAVAVALSLLGSTVFLLLVVLAALHLNKNSK